MDLRRLFNQRTLNPAYAWLCAQRAHFPPNSDVWHLRFHWERIAPDLLARLRQGRYRFSPLVRITKTDGSTLHLWSAQDALVLKMLAMGIAPSLGCSPHCTHLKGHGGLKQTIARVQQRLPRYRFVIRTDVQGFYEHIDQYQLLDQLAEHIRDPTLLNYLWQVIRRTVCHGGHYREIQQGISRGCPLSPLLGALYLRGLEKELGGRPGGAGVFYVRYMDDVLILATTRWKLRHAIRTLHAHFNALKLGMHPDKTSIGRIEKGFDFLGYHFSRGPLSLAKQTVRKHVERVLRLYEQQATKKATPSEVALVLGAHVKRWRRWCRAGLGQVTTAFSPYGAYRLGPPDPDRAE